MNTTINLSVAESCADELMKPEVLERAAFACFPTLLSDEYKRTLFIVTAALLEREGNLTVNKLYSMVRRIIPATPQELNSVVASLETPFQSVTTNHYYRSSERNNSDRKMITSITFTGSEAWNTWSEYVRDTYPELEHWKGRTYGTVV